MADEQENLTPAPETENLGGDAAPAAPEVETPAPGTPAPAEGEPAAPAEAAPEVDAEGNPVAPAYKPQTKFKAGVFNKETRDLEQREFEIDKRFHSLMKDAESEKLVRELHTKAFGLDGVKERLMETRTQMADVQRENHRVISSVNELKGIYQGAVKSGDWLKLDGFFERLNIPEEHVLNYALEKVKLNELAQSNPTAYQSIMSRQNSEKENERLARQQAESQSQYAQQAYETKMLQLDLAVQSPTVASIASDYDQQVGREGAFKELVKREGEYAFIQSQGKVDLTAAQAVERALATLGRKPASPGAPAPQVPPQGGQQPGNPQKVVVQRTNQHIPNIGGGAGSPLKTKMRSIDDIKNYAKQNYGQG